MSLLDKIPDSTKLNISNFIENIEKYNVENITPAEPKIEIYINGKRFYKNHYTFRWFTKREATLALNKAIGMSIFHTYSAIETNVTTRMEAYNSISNLRKLWEKQGIISYTEIK